MTEDAFLRRLFQRLGPVPPAVAVPPGDDCAAISWTRGRLLLLAVDQVVAGRHYVLQGPNAAKPEAAGRKLLARNLSDIAAMGGVPLYALVAVAVGAGQSPAWLRRFHDGILALAREFGVTLIGGDLATAPCDTVASLTVVGDVPARHVCRRGAARPGDILFVTGRFGDSYPTRHHLTFMPRCREGQWLASKGFTRAMMDVSDGLALDAARLCRASGLTLLLDIEAVPRRRRRTTSIQALGDGEDYELLVAVPASRAARLQRAWPFARVPLTPVGRFVRQRRTPVCDASGHPLHTIPGFDHFAP